MTLLTNVTKLALLVFLVFPGVTSTAQGVASAHKDAGSPTVLVDADKQENFSLNGDWHIVAAPYVAGQLDFHMHVNPEGYFKDATAAPSSNKLVEYNFSKAETIHVPGDWNTQKEWLRMYEGALWYERKFNFNLQPVKRVWLHISAANYRSRMFLNGSEICEHEGGFTAFDCEAAKFLKPGENDAVIFTDNTRIADGIPTLKTDWYNYGGLTRDVSIITTPAAFIDDFDLHLDRPTRSVVEGYVHVDGGEPRTSVAVEIPEAKLRFEGVIDTAGRVAVRIPAAHLSLWQPGNPSCIRLC